ncbi:MAG TPA: glycogen synthase [Steroidobacteraceae bacterium]|nr:glycogen synthase [Steroidobacteraceae bacterium]
MKLSICAIASEVVPLAKSGGLADVASALSRQLTAVGHDVRLFMPFYSQIRRDRLELARVETLQGLPIVTGRHEYRVDIWKAKLPGGSATAPPTHVYLVESDALYARGRLYTGDPDEHRRFLVLTRAALECCRRMQFRPHIVHSHDWHTAFAPLWLRSNYKADPIFTGTRSVMTIHNIGYQGEFSAADAGDLDLGADAYLLHQDDLRAGRVNALKSGILHADAVTTVSPTYAREITTPQFGMGMEAALAARGSAVSGILNGVDYEEWDPRRDRYLPIHFSAADLARKAELKRNFLLRQNLKPTHGRVPLFGIVSRLASQKGFDLLTESLPRLLQDHDVRLAVVGTGDPQYEKFFAGLADRFRGRAWFFSGYDESLAHWIEGASDMFLMPSLYEPCGLNQMYSLRYGTIPVVRRTGGLADSVTHFDPATGVGTGIVFNDFDAGAMNWALDTAMEWYAQSALWHRIVQNAMARDFSWEAQANEYLRLFARLLQVDAAALIERDTPQKAAR